MTSARSNSLSLKYQVAKIHGLENLSLCQSVNHAIPLKLQPARLIRNSENFVKYTGLDISH